MKRIAVKFIFVIKFSAQSWAGIDNCTLPSPKSCRGLYFAANFSRHRVLFLFSRTAPWSFWNRSHGWVLHGVLRILMFIAKGRHQYSRSEAHLNDANTQHQTWNPSSFKVDMYGYVRSVLPRNLHQGWNNQPTETRSITQRKEKKTVETYTTSLSTLNSKHPSISGFWLYAIYVAYMSHYRRIKIAEKQQESKSE